MLTTTICTTSTMAQEAPSEQPRGWRADFLVGVAITSARFTDFRATVDEENVRDPSNLQALELSLGPRSGGVGLVGRYQRAGRGEMQFMLRDGGIYFGGRAFRIEAAYAERQMPGEDLTRNLARAGIRSRVPIGYGFAGVFAGSGYGKLNREDGERVLNAWEGESHLMFVPPRVPIYVQGGYRMGRHKIGTQDPESTFKGVTIGAGLWTNAY